jgi:outer membrane scaffolding protein for murein synthesis (MipA/OmpV family)
VLVSTDGTTWNPLGTTHDYNWYSHAWLNAMGPMGYTGWSDEDNQWRTVSYRIPPSITQGSENFYIAFTYGADSYTHPFDGFAFDNVTIDISKFNH